MKNVNRLFIVVIINFFVINAHPQTGSNTSPESTGVTNAAGVNILTPSKKNPARVNPVKIKPRANIEVQKSTCTSTDIACLELQKKK